MVRQQIPETSVNPPLNIAAPWLKSASNDDVVGYHLVNHADCDKRRWRAAERRFSSINSDQQEHPYKHVCVCVCVVTVVVVLWLRETQFGEMRSNFLYAILYCIIFLFYVHHLRSFTSTVSLPHIRHIWRREAYISSETGRTLRKLGTEMGIKKEWPYKIFGEITPGLLRKGPNTDFIVRTHHLGHFCFTDLA